MRFPFVLCLVFSLAACGADADAPDRSSDRARPTATAADGRAPLGDGATISAALDAIERAFPETLEEFVPRKVDLTNAEHTSFAPFSIVQVEYADGGSRKLRATVTYDLDADVLDEAWNVAYAEAAIREYMDGVTTVERLPGQHRGREASRVHVQRTATEAGNEGLFDTRVLGVRLGAHCFVQLGTPIADAVPADELERLMGAFDLDRIEAVCAQPPSLETPDATPLAISEDAAGARAAFERLTAETADTAPPPEELVPPLDLLRALPAALDGLVLTEASASLNSRGPRSQAGASYEGEDDRRFGISLRDDGVMTSMRKFDLERPDRLFGCFQEGGEGQPVLVGVHPGCLTPNASRPEAGRLFVLLDGGMDVDVSWRDLSRADLEAALGGFDFDGLTTR